MDAFVRQTALEILLERFGELSSEELHRAVGLGMSDPDLQIVEKTVAFIAKQKAAKEFGSELQVGFHNLKSQADPEAQLLARKIQALLTPQTSKA